MGSSGRTTINMSTHDESAGPEGYDQPAVEAWIDEHVDSLTPPLDWTRLEGGHSNLTYRLSDRSGRLAVIRRPPQGELLPKAHDMSREWSLISALGPTRVPVPAALAFCESPDITGAWFYVMGLVEGRPLYNAADAIAWVPEDKRRQLAHSFIDVLADLHDVDPDEVGLSNLGKRNGYVMRQLRTWYRSWTASAEPANLDDPRAHELQAFFLEHLPDQGPARIVHGDYGLHNCLTGRDSFIAAVVDWEISTLGDPLADLAYSYVACFMGTGEVLELLPGLPTEDDFIGRYCELTDRGGIPDWTFYKVFQLFRLAAIAQGVYKRGLDGISSSAKAVTHGDKCRLRAVAAWAMVAS